MRTGVVAVVTAGIILGVGYLAWQAVEDRRDTEVARPADAFAELADALRDGPDADLAFLRSGQEELAEGIAMVEAALPGATWEVTHGAVTQEGGRASGELTITLTSDLGEITWDTPVEATRARSEWGIDATAATLHPNLRPGYRVVVQRENTTRSSLLAHDGEALTSHGTAVAIGIAPGTVTNQRRLIDTWGQVLPHSLEELEELLDRGDTNPTWFYPVVTVSAERHEEVWPQLRTIPGVIARGNQEVTPEDDALALHVLGRVGEPTAEQAQQLGVQAGERVGLLGLERVFEQRLVGSDVVEVSIVSSDDVGVAELARIQDDPSEPVTTTLDRTVQQALENALTGVSTSAGVVVVDVDSAAIRAAASRPLGGYNRAFEGDYPPGDAFLPVVAEALLANGIQLDDDTSCPATDSVAGAALSANRRLRQATVGRALAAGCDTTLGILATEISTDDLVAATERFGWGIEPGLPLTAATPSLPEPIDATERVRTAVGQARVQASVLHMASAVAAAQSGTWHEPHLLAEQDDGVSTDLTDSARRPLRRLLRMGSNRGATGAFLRPLDATGFVGTAPVTGADTEHAWVVGVVDDLAFAVLVEDTGGQTRQATTIAERFLNELAALRN